MKTSVYTLTLFLAVVSHASADYKLQDSQVINSVFRQSQLAEGMPRAKLSRDQLTEILPHHLGQADDCNAEDGMGCVETVLDAVLACIAEVTDLGLGSCVALIVDDSSPCFKCICWVIEYLGLIC